MQDEKYQQKSKSISSAEPNYFVHFAMRHPVVELIDGKGIGVAQFTCLCVRHKLKNSLKTQKTHFLPVFELMSDSHTTIKVEPHQCPSHQSILHIQGPITEILMKKY